MKRIYLIIIFQVLIFCGANAQTWEWTHPEPNGTAGATSETDAAHDVEIDPSGNSYVLGDFLGSLYLNNSLITNGNGSYLAKYDVNGSLLWYKLFLPTYTPDFYYPTSIRATDLVINSAGVFITGKYKPSTTNGYDCTTNSPLPIPNPRTYSIGSLNFTSAYNDLGIFLTKMDFNGNVVWNKTGTQNDYCSSTTVYHGGGSISYNPLLTTDGNNNIITAFVCGSSLASISIGSSTIMLSSTVMEKQQIVAVKLNSDGIAQWSNYAVGDNTSTGSAQCTSLIADNNGNIFLHGETGDGYVFGSEVYHISTATQSAFLAKLSAAGFWQFVKELAGSSQNTLNSSGADGNPDFLAVDSANNVYALVNLVGVGSSLTGVILGETVPIDQTMSYLVKLDNNGNPLYKKGFGSYSSQANSICYANGFLYIAGNIRNQVDYAWGNHPWYFSSLTVKPTSIPNGAPAEYFVSKVDTDGDYKWVTSFSGDFGYHEGLAVKAVADNVYTAGYYRGSIKNLGNLNGSYSTNDNGTENIFFGKVKDQYIRIGAVAPTSLCPGATFTIPFTSYGLTFSATNTFTAQISNAGGDFTIPRNVGSVVSTGSGTITATLPTDLLLGTSGYKVRIVSSNLLATGFPYYVYADTSYTLTVATQTYYQDADGDGYGNAAVSLQTCTPPSNYVLNNTDCDDNNAAVNPATVWYLDADNDNYYTGTGVTQCLSPGTGYKYAGLIGGGDCNDANAAVNPATVWYLDADNDNYYTGTGITQCTSPGTGYKYSGLIGGGDCNDNNAAVNPATVWYLDADNDNYYTGAGITQCTSPGTGYKYSGLIGGGDCNDNNAAINPGATEICNGIDDNCNGVIDEGCAIAVSVNINDVTVYESQGLAVLTVSLSKISTQAITINYKTVDGTAVSKGRNKDFVSQKGTLIIPAGTISGTISINIINDGLPEPTEYFDVLLSLSRTGNVTISKSTGRVTIIDGTPPVTRQQVDIEKINTGGGIVLTAAPNPSRSRFTVKVETDNFKDVIHLRVIDISGKAIETRQSVLPGEVLQLGDQYQPGVYFIEVLQGRNRRQLKLVKL